jgi:hypothetical protein
VQGTKDTASLTYGDRSSIISNVRTTAVLVDHINALTGESSNSTSTVSQAALAESGVFDDVLDFLSQRDKPTILVKLLMNDFHNLWPIQIWHLQHVQAWAAPMSLCPMRQLPQH